ncbi:Arm DNA-binding domain-containing protein [Mesorhizobium australicum]|uniref:hypothetical protein n=1 Tax=Mesorhizobium australicum TaxID=536018 RepID=UPI00333DDDEE
MLGKIAVSLPQPLPATVSPTRLISGYKTGYHFVNRVFQGRAMLTDIQIRNEKPTGKPYKLADGGGFTCS